METRVQRFWFPVFLVAYEIATFLSNDMYLPGLPSIARDLNAPDSWAQYTLTAWFVGAGSMQLILGPLSDRYGRKLVLLSGAVLFIASTIYCALTHSIHGMLVARFFQGSSVCSVGVAGYAVIHELYRGKRAVQIISIMGAVTVLAPALGPLGGALVVTVSTWRMVFWILALWGVITTVALFWVMPETWVEKSSLHVRDITRDYKAILSNRNFLRFTLVFCFLITSFFVWIVDSPFVLLEGLHKTPLYYGMAQLFVFGSFVVGALITKNAISHFAARHIITFSLCLSLLGAVLFFVAVRGGSTDWAIATMVLIALGASMSFGPLNRLAVEACDQAMGRRMAIFSTLVSGFGGLGSILVTFFSNESFRSISVIILVCTALSLLLYLSGGTSARLHDEE